MHSVCSSSYSDENSAFDITNHVFCVDEPITMENIHQYSRDFSLVAILASIHPIGNTSHRAPSLASDHLLQPDRQSGRIVGHFIPLSLLPRRWHVPPANVPNRGSKQFGADRYRRSRPLFVQLVRKRRRHRGNAPHRNGERNAHRDGFNRAGGGHASRGSFAEGFEALWVQVVAHGKLLETDLHEEGQAESAANEEICRCAEGTMRGIAHDGRENRGSQRIERTRFDSE